MKQKVMFLIMSALLSLSMLSACNLDNNNEINDPEDVNYEPVRYDRTNDREIDTRGADLDTDPRNVRDRQEPDTPFNMDEEEPDLDEEPSEERRGW
ncbi:hypothetical protein [Bacillus taeanensis]|uniref:Uncharacterized protein n=1 Tax=Bacillus taeanensis TaxID=273032 RepID=A0A366XUP1_9BACI|nr:hypothetical protein [Bacillus taeanensis]RBW68489.1 hypothetical protein DS031_16040 [Bacillus taeanensis]